MIPRAIIAAVHPGWALALSLAVAPQPGPSSPATSDLLSELAAKVAAIVGARTPPPKISIRCSDNLRERVCTADIDDGTAREVVIVTRPHEQAPGDAMTTEIPVVVQLRPVVAQANPILDVVQVGRRLIVLDPLAVTVHETAAEGWRRLASYPIASANPWPRDVRGRLVVEGGSWTAFIPGGSCRGSLDPMRGGCQGDQIPWPLEIENTGLVAGRNVFTTADGLRYFGIAPLDVDAGARWVAAAETGRLLLLDDERRPLEPPVGTGDDVAAISTSCGPGKHIVVAGRATEDGLDTIRVVRVAARQVADVASPVAVAGRVTALWPTPAGDRALVVTRNPTTRGYEAFQVGLACGR
jgi:hypothetical protein